MMSQTIVDTESPLEGGGAQPPSEPLSKGGFAFRLCYTCNVVKPISEFYRALTQCKPCVLARRKRHLQESPEARALKKATANRYRNANKEKCRRYYESHREYFRESGRKHWLKVTSNRPPKTPCELGHERVWFKGQWFCWKCLRREKTIDRYAKWLSSKGGQKLTEIYRRYLQKHPKSIRPSIPLLKKLCLPTDWQCLSKNCLERIDLLNTLLHLPCGNIGWTCSTCKTYSTEPRFFDIDHIVPRHKKGRDHHSNMQVLCPNCHRAKTLNDLSYHATSEPQFLTAIGLPAEATGSR